MSKRTNYSSGISLRGFCTSLFLFFVPVLLVTTPASAQDKGFSIFEKPAEDIASEPVVISAKEAFTNPTVKLPKSQFGSFTNPKPADSKPQLRGSKAVGTYAHDGRGMFAKAPNEVSEQAGKLKPFASNSLRSNDRPQPDNDDAESHPPVVVSDFPASKPQVAPPVVVGDFEKSAQRLAPRSKKPETSQKVTNPKIAQVTFQEGGFKPAGGSSFNTQNRFDQGRSQRRSGLGANPNNGMGQRTSRAQQQPPRQQLAPQSQPQPGTGYQGLRQPRTAALPRTQQPGQNPFANRGQGAPSNGQRISQPNSGNSMQNTKSQGTGAKAAKELLNQWLQPGEQQANTPGKQMKLHEFLAQPINGSRKNAINQYWVTFSDMAKHRLAVQQASWLESIGQPQQQTDQVILKAEQQKAQNHVLHTEIQLTKSQLLLSEYVPNLRDNKGRTVPVLPANIPWVGKLNTKYDEYQKRGMIPAKFNSIDDILPKMRQLIANEADTVIASAQAAEQAKDAMKSGRAPIANVLEAARMKSQSEDQFLTTVVGYNRAITDYVLSVRQDIYQPKRLASVLIGKKAVAKTVQTNAAPEEDTDPLAGVSSNPQMRQISTTQRSQQQKSLPGKSAYQNGYGQQRQPSQPQVLATQENQQAQQLASQVGDGGQAPQKKATQSFDYGPTAESASAANFDPAKVKEELPMQQFQPKGKSDYARGGSQVATRPGGNTRAGSSRTASQPMGSQRSPLKNRSPNGYTGGSNRVGAPTGSAPNAARSTFPGAGGAPAPTQPAPPVTSGASGSGGGSPFSSTPDPTAGASNAGRVNKAFGGGGTFGGGGSFGGGSAGASGGGTFGGSQPSGSPGTRLGNSGSSGGSLR
jgi:hypothetical protein